MKYKPRIDEETLLSEESPKILLVVATPEGHPYQLPHDGSLFQEIVNDLLAKDPYMFHPEGSPYLGLSVREQRILAVHRRGGVKMPAALLRQMRPPTKEDYEKLFLHCVNSLVRDWLDDNVRLDRSKVFMKLPFNYKDRYSRKLPEVNVFAHDDYTITVGWKLDKIVDWLYSHGHSPFPAKDLRKNLWVILKEQEKIGFYQEIAADTSIIELYGDLIEGANSGKISRVDKGRKFHNRRPRKIKEEITQEVVDENVKTL